MKDYYTVVASLPFLPYFAHAERLPLTRLRLEQRLRMLEAHETRQIYQAEKLAGWRLSAEKLSSRNFLPNVTKVLQSIEQPVLRDYVEYRLEIQTILAALRIRHAQPDFSQNPEIWGNGRWVNHIEAHWDVPDFRLGSIYPWVLEASKLIAAAKIVELERLLMDTVWRRLCQLADDNPFGFEAITAFVFKWDILQSWLIHDAAAAKQRFQKLMDEVRHV